jgi:acyl-coenzyme A thioesterase PaaI-like protein
MVDLNIGATSRPVAQSFSGVTAVEAVGPDRCRATIPEGWDIAGNVNGGLLLAVAARALGAATERPEPVTITGHFLSPGRTGAVEISTEVLKRGRRFATGRATLHVDGRALLAVLGAFGEHDDQREVLLADGGPPSLPPAGECVRIEPTATFPPPFAAQVEMRLHPEDATFLEGRPSGRTSLRAWVRFADGEPIDTLGLLCLADSLPPTIFNADFPIAWTPTIELTAHVRGRPAPGWLRSTATTRFVSDGFLEVDVELWDSTDRLVAQARQLALVPRAEPTVGADLGPPSP